MTNFGDETIQKAHCMLEGAQDEIHTQGHK